MKVLVEEGRARVDIKSRNKNTPLDSAHLASATAVVTYLETKVRRVWGLCGCGGEGGRASLECGITFQMLWLEGWF